MCTTFFCYIFVLPVLIVPLNLLVSLILLFPSDKVNTFDVLRNIIALFVPMELTLVILCYMGRNSCNIFRS